MESGNLGMTLEFWTVIGTGFTLAALGTTAFTLLWRYITRAEKLRELEGLREAMTGKRAA